jgi:hypothetical protein
MPMLYDLQYDITHIETRNIFVSHKSTGVTASRDVMVKLFLCVTKHYSMKAYGGGDV